MMATPFFRQAWVLTAVWANMMGQGMMLSYTTSLLPALQDPESSIRADLHTASWIASICGIAGIPGVLLSSFFMDTYGRKKAHLLVMLPGIIGWLCIYFAQNIAAILVGRILGGITAGATVFLGAIAIGEFSTPIYRGIFLNFKTAAVCFGSTVGHILAFFVSWRTIALISLIPYIIAVLIVTMWPETPAWLASKGEFDKSRKSFYWMREKSETSTREIEELIKTQMDRLSKPIEKKSMTEDMLDVLKIFTKKDFLKPTLIIVISYVLLETSGRHLFPAYGSQIMGEISGKSNPFYYTLGIDLIITVSAVSSSILVKIMKRRTLLFSTGFAAFVVIMIACAYLTLAANNYISNDRSWIVIGIFVVYFILANLGCTPIPLALMGELLPLRHRGIGSAFIGIIMSLCVMGALKVTPYLQFYLKVQGMFFIYGISTALALMVLYFLLPETKDRTLQEIEYYFNNGKYKEHTTNEDEELKLKMMKKENV